MIIFLAQSYENVGRLDVHPLILQRGVGQIRGKAHLFSKFRLFTISRMFFKNNAAVTTAVCLLTSLIGCATGEKIRNVQPGMTKSEVVSILGQPDGFKVVEGHEVFGYSNRATSGWSWDRADYNVVFFNGRVVEYGAGEVRPGPRPQTVFIYRL